MIYSGIDRGTARGRTGKRSQQSVSEAIGIDRYARRRHDQEVPEVNEGSAGVVDLGREPGSEVLEVSLDGQHEHVSVTDQVGPLLRRRLTVEDSEDDAALFRRIHLLLDRPEVEAEIGHVPELGGDGQKPLARPAVVAVETHFTIRPGVSAMPEHENRGYRRLFEDGFSVGLFFPITTSEAAVPPMDRQVERARLAAEVGFDALWFRDVPLFWPKFGDAGQVYDPWVYLSHVAAKTEDITLATGSIVLPLRHPLHVAKAAASIDRLSDGRVVLGVASGDRPPEFPAFDVEESAAPERFRESVRVLRRVWSEEYPELDSPFGELDGSLDSLPKPTTEALPLLVTGYAGQDPEWIAEHGDGWVYYQRDPDDLRETLDNWRAHTDGHKPYVQVLHVDLDPDPTAGPGRIHQGYAGGSEWFHEHLRDLRKLGVDHVMINVRHGERDTESVLREFGEDVLGEL